MTIDERNEPSPQTRSAPKVVAPTNRVNVALPFSHIHTHEPSKELAELAAVVADLASVVEEIAPGPRDKNLRERAQTLAAQLR